MKCTDCGNAMTKDVSDYRYTESGLDNVVLHNITTSECPRCGARRVTIGAIASLHRAIAKSLAEKPGRLLPQEVRFLRDHLELSNREFAELMGVTEEHASRWMRTNAIGATAERFLRVLAVLGPEPLSGRRKQAEGPKLEPVDDAAAVSLFREVTYVIEHMPSMSAAEPSKAEIDLHRSSNHGWKSQPKTTN